MVKVLFLPLNYGEVIQEGMYDAFRQAGCELEIFDYFHYYNQKKNVRSARNLLVTKARQFRPDLMHMQIQHTSVIDAGTVQTIKSENPNLIITNWTGDVRDYVPKTYKSIAAVSDYNLISSTGQIPLFENEIKKKIYYWQIGYNPKFYYPENAVRTNFEWDISFAGNVARKDNHRDAPLRMQACRMLRREFGDRFGLAGDGWPKDLRSMGSREQKTLSQSVFHKSFCNLNINHYNQINHYFSDRLLMILASGRPVISLAFPNWESYFTNLSDLIIVENINEIPNKVRMLKTNPDLANFIGNSGAAKVFAEHTYYSRVKELLNIVGLT